MHTHVIQVKSALCVNNALLNDGNNWMVFGQVGEDGSEDPPYTGLTKSQALKLAMTVHKYNQTGEISEFTKAEALKNVTYENKNFNWGVDSRPVWDKLHNQAKEVKA